MKNYRKSDYALNKFSEGIVYQFSDRTLEISLEDFMRDNPGKTEADFMALKAVSDEIYLEQARLETAQGNKTFSMTGLEDAIAHPAPSLDDSLLQSPLSNHREFCKELSERVYEIFLKCPVPERNRKILHFDGKWPRCRGPPSNLNFKNSDWR